MNKKQNGNHTGRIRTKCLKQTTTRKSAARGEKRHSSYRGPKICRRAGFLLKTIQTRVQGCNIYQVGNKKKTASLQFFTQEKYLSKQKSGCFETEAKRIHQWQILTARNAVLRAEGKRYHLDIWVCTRSEDQIW